MSRFCFCVFWLSGVVVHAGSVVLPDFQTVWSAGLTPPSRSQVLSQTEQIVSLDDRTGLTPGAPIRITVTTSDHFLWVGGFCYDVGRLEVTSTPTLRLLIGESTSFVTSTLY
jgi:hypothetical protein